MIVIGWDPGLASLGYAVCEFEPAKTRVLAHGDIGEPAGDRDEVRLDRICKTVDDLMNRWTPDMMGYEQQSGVFVGKDREGEAKTWHARRIFDVLGILRMAANCALAEAVPLYTPAVSSVKVAILGKGYGHADKAAVQSAVKRLFGVRGNSHECDAVAVAVASVVQHRLHIALRERERRRMVAR